MASPIIRLVRVPALAKTVIVLVTGVCATGSENTPAPDLRINKLEHFFRSYGCPEPHHAATYVHTADAHNLDYRLLPAISLVESTCGIHANMNNLWGWNSGKTAFASVEEGIEFILAQLAHHRPYRGEETEGKLLRYNPNPQYRLQVLRIMQEIEP